MAGESPVDDEVRAMTERFDLDRELNAYLHARATSQAPDGLLRTALGQIEATSQRPGWLVLDRWLPAQATGPDSAR